MSRTMKTNNRTMTRTMTADECVTRALEWDRRATDARLAAFRADRDGDADKAHAATKEWTNAAHFVRVLSKRGAVALRSEGRNANALIEVLMHDRAARAESMTNPAGPPL